MLLAVMGRRAVGRPLLSRMSTKRQIPLLLKPLSVVSLPSVAIEGLSKRTVLLARSLFC